MIINDWDVSKVTQINSAFRDAQAFNGNISNWNVSSVTNMNGAFEGASSFNRDISNWDVSGVSFMYKMFFYASSFNQNLSSWNTCNVVDNNLFYGGSNAWESGNRPKWGPCINEVSSSNLDGTYRKMI